jgi:hypothetical protein
MAGVPPNPPPAGPFIGEYPVPNVNFDPNKIRVPPKRSLWPQKGIWELEKEVLSSLPTNQRENYENYVMKDFIEGFSDPSYGSSYLIQPMKVELFSSIKGNRDLQDLIAALTKVAPSIQDPATRSKLQTVFTIYTSASSLKGLNRFLHINQTRLSGQPLPDGSNISK